MLQLAVVDPSPKACSRADQSGDTSQPSGPPEAPCLEVRPAAFWEIFPPCRFERCMRSLSVGRASTCVLAQPARSHDATLTAPQRRRRQFARR
jgi:hypothetical protein